MILAICLSVLLCFVLAWLLAAHLGTRRILRWGYQRQANQLGNEAEKIREGLLQESFALRRSLELALADDRACTKEVKTWLTQMETIQHSLEALTDRLSPPYLNDSLPLAIQHILQHWQTTHPGLRLDIELPMHWGEEPIAQRRVILAFLKELLPIIAAQPLPETVLYAQLKTSFSQQARSSLLIQLTAPNTADLFASAGPELADLQQFFQVLADGKCYCQQQGSTVTWRCQWRSP